MLKAAIHLITCLILGVVYSANIPPSPCPGIFKYVQNYNNIFGTLTFQNDLSGYYELEVSMSVPMQTNQNIQITKTTSDINIYKGENVEYTIQFPFRNLVPRLIRVTFNGNVYCSGPPENAPVTTTLTRKHIFKINISPTAISRPFSPQQNTPEPHPSQELIFRPASNNRPTYNQQGNNYYYPSNDMKNVSFIILPDQDQVSFYPSNNKYPSNYKPLFPEQEENQFPELGAQGLPVQIHINIDNKNEINNNNGGFGGLYDECGYNRFATQLVVSGTPTKIGEYPWLVALIYFNGQTHKFHCGGSIISKSHIITAAHCLRVEEKNLEHDHFTVVLGKNNIKNFLSKSIVRGVKDIFIHPDYKSLKSDADIGILIMDTTVKFSETLRPVCLWKESSELFHIVGMNGSVAGWGRDEFGSESVVEARQVTMPIVSQETCLRSNTAYAHLTSEKTFCAGDRKGHAPCSGDSGSGFVMNRDGKWYLRGIVSLSLRGLEHGCNPDEYTIFCDAPKHGTWIQKILELS